MAGAYLVVELLGKGLQIDVRGIHPAVHFATCLGTLIARRHRHSLQAELMTRLRRVDRVLVEHDGVVVRERDAAAAERLGHARELLRARRVGELVDLARLGDVPVLAILARQVTSRCPERQDRRPRQVMIQRLFLYRVDAEPARSAVARQNDLMVSPRPNEAQALLSLVQLARARTDVALDAPVGQRVPVARRHDAVADVPGQAGSACGGGHRRNDPSGSAEGPRFVVSMMDLAETDARDAQESATCGGWHVQSRRSARIARGGRAARP